MTKNTTQLDHKQVIVPLRRCPNTRSVTTTFSHINARSIYHIIPNFQDYITTNKISVCAITETWLKNDPDDLRYKEIAPIGYNVISHPRSLGRQGGGTALVYKNGFNIVDKTDTHASLRLWNLLSTTSHSRPRPSICMLSTDHPQPVS